MEIAVFLDGELSLREELELEVHLENCQHCTAELNSQKRLLDALNLTAGIEKDLVLPVNFTKTIVANAESRVNGLRLPRERFNALLICAGLFLLVILGLGAESSSVFETTADLIGQTAAFGNIVGHFIYDFALLITVVMRSLCGQFIFKSEPINSLLLILFAVSSFVFVRQMLRYKQI